MKLTVIQLVVGALETMPKGLELGLEDLEKEGSRNHPDHSQNPENFCCSIRSNILFILLYVTKHIIPIVLYDLSYCFYCRMWSTIWFLSLSEFYHIIVIMIYC